jgi:hypothetical protein
MIDAKEFLRTVKSLTETQATANVFKAATPTASAGLRASTRWRRCDRS